VTDRELLELAAKAAGMTDASFDADLDCITYCHEAGPYGAQFKTWNPINDDGDALRLAVKLGLHISQQLSYVSVMQPHSSAATRGICWTESYGLDEYTATRRAIVRAAAAIGEAKP
jgi:hypothetical protein